MWRGPLHCSKCPRVEGEQQKYAGWWQCPEKVSICLIFPPLTCLKNWRGLWLNWIQSEWKWVKLCETSNSGLRMLCTCSPTKWARQPSSTDLTELSSFSSSNLLLPALGCSSFPELRDSGARRLEFQSFVKLNLCPISGAMEPSSKPDTWSGTFHPGSQLCPVKVAGEMSP